MIRNISGTRRSLGAATFAGALILTGCSTQNPPTTAINYAPADGYNFEFGDIKVADILVVGANEGSPGQVHGQLSNITTDDLQVRLQATDVANFDVTVTVPAQSTVRLDGQTSGNGSATTNPVTIPSLPAKPGDEMQLIATTASGQQIVSIPVLLDQYPYGSAAVEHDEYEEPAEPGHEGEAEAGGH